MKNNPWKSIDFFTRQPEMDIYLWLAMKQARGSLIVPGSLLGEVGSFEARTESMGTLNRENAVMVCNEADMKYVRNRNRARPVMLVNESNITVLTAEGVDAILQRTPDAVDEFMLAKNPQPRRVERVHEETIGILYMCFGAKAAREVRKSLSSLQEIGLDIPVCVVGDDLPPALQEMGVQFIEWKGESPFDAGQKKNFQFRAGRIKPHLYKLSPYQRTLYLDADTEFMGDILTGFDYLDTFDMAVTEESLTLGQLYNKKLAGWEINLVERDATIEELGGDARQEFINSGVIFFRKCQGTEKTFIEWGLQWQRFQQWDEQLALMRALYKCQANYKALSVDWNHPHKEKATIIFHNYGRGVARMNVSTR